LDDVNKMAMGIEENFEKKYSIIGDKIGEVSLFYPFLTRE